MCNRAYLYFKGLASQCKAQEKYKERLDLGVTWLKWLPTGMESKTRLAPRSNKVNSQKLTLDWNTSLCYRVIWKWHQSAFHANNHAIGGGSNGIIMVSRQLSDISCKIRQLSDRTTVRSDNCQWGQLSVGTTVSGDNCQWRQLSVGTTVSGPTVSGNCKCFPGIETTVRSYSFRADNCMILQFQIATVPSVDLYPHSTSRCPRAQIQ